MTTKDSISGKGKILKLIKDLHDDSAVLTMRILGQDFERLTIVTNLVKENGKTYFVIDQPDGFMESIQSETGAELFFQFVGRDKVHYSFKSEPVKIENRDVWIKSPDSIDRIQRRRFFRLAPPIDTTIAFSLNLQNHEFRVLNVSEGGILVSERRTLLRKPRLDENQNINNVVLSCNDRVLRFQTNIRQVRVKRAFSNADSGKFNYALQVVDMGQKEGVALGEWIFKCQREFLRKRQFLKGT